MELDLCKMSLNCAEAVGMASGNEKKNIHLNGTYPLVNYIYYTSYTCKTFMSIPYNN